MHSLYKTLPPHLHPFAPTLRELSKTPNFSHRLQTFILEENFIHKITQIQHYATSIPLLLDNPQYTHDTPLCCACRHGNFDSAKLLIELGANVNRVYKDKEEARLRTPLGNALLYLDDLPKDAVQKYVDDEDNIIKLLLEKGADPNFQFQSWDMFDLTSPLFVAINMRSVKLVNMLLDYGAKVDLHRKDYFGHLHANTLDAAIYGGNDIDIEKIILARCDEEELRVTLDRK